MHRPAALPTNNKKSAQVGKSNGKELELWWPENNIVLFQGMEINKR